MLKKNLLLAVTFSLCAPTILGFSNGNSADLSNALRTEGYFEIANDKYLKNDYNRLYQSYDSFIEMVMSKNEIFTVISQSEKEFFQLDQQGQRYCLAPPSFRNPAVHTKKINNRIYFQFIKESYELLKVNHPDIFLENPSLSVFFTELSQIDMMAKYYFEQVLNELEKNYPHIKKAMYGKHGELTVVTKIVRYEQSEQWLDRPHFDKSALTLIWDSDDPNHDSLHICGDTEDPQVEMLRLPTRLYAQENNRTSTILITGLCLENAGYDVKPTLHYVAPIKQKYRHSLISFLLIPNSDTRDLKTEFQPEVKPRSRL